MGIVNNLDQVWQNTLGILVVSLVFFWIYKNMEDTAFKRWVSDTITKIKEGFNNDE